MKTLLIVAVPLLVLPLCAQLLLAADAPGKPPFHYLWSTAYHIPSEFTTDESGYFALCEGHNGKIYIGAAAYGRDSYLVEFDPKTEKMRVVVDSHKVLGLPLTPTGYAAQSKIHTRLFVGTSGKIYMGTKEGYRRGPEDTAEYMGGYVMVYDPGADTTQNLGMPYPKQGVIDVVADEARGLMYVVTCEDQHWMLYDAKTKKYRELGPILYPYAATLIDEKGRANALTKDYSLARYDPATDKVTVIPLALDGKPFTPASKTLDQGWIPTWNLAADRRTAYLLRMNHSELLRIDLGGDESPGQSIAVANMGVMVQGKSPDSRCSLTVGPDGGVYVDIRTDNTTGFGGGYLDHIARFDPRNNKIEELGVLVVKNPDFYGLPLGNPGGAVDQNGKPRPWTHGYHKLPDGTLTPLYGHMGLIAAHDGTLYATILYPFTLLRVPPDQLKWKD